jgi:hypothetical protein
MYSNDSKPSSVATALRNAGIPPMQAYTDGVVDGLDSLNAVPGNGQPVGDLPLPCIDQLTNVMQIVDG